MKFVWEPVLYTSSKLLLQLDFSNPYEISNEFEPNVLDVIIWDEDLFVRESDLATVDQ